MTHDRPPVHHETEELQTSESIDAVPDSVFTAMREHLRDEGLEHSQIEVLDRVLRILSAIYMDSFLAKRLCLHGGLPIGMVFSDGEPSRYSYDIDPVYRHVDVGKDWGEVRDQIDEHIKRILDSQGYERENISIHPTYKLNRFIINFVTKMGEKKKFLIEIGYMDRNSLVKDGDSWMALRIPGTEREIQLRVASREEVFANKFLALLMRDSSRDVYDIWRLSQMKLEIDMVLFKKLVVLISLGDMEHPIYLENPTPLLSRKIADQSLKGRLSEPMWTIVEENQDAILQEVYDFVKEVLNNITASERAAIDLFYEEEQVHAKNKDEAIHLSKGAVKRVVDILDPEDILSEGVREFPPLVDMWFEIHTKFGWREGKGRRRIRND